MQTNKTLRAIILGGIFILPFIFFWNPSNYFFPFITGKNFAFRIIVEIIAALWAILALRDPEYRPKSAWILWTYSAFILILVAADLSGLDPARSFWSNSERMDGLVTQLHLFLYFLVACASLSTAKLWDAFIKTTIGASILMSLYGLLQILHLATIDQSASRVDGTFGNATYLAVYLVFHIFLILAVLAREWKDSSFSSLAWRWVLVPSLALECLALYSTATRGDILGLGFGVLIAALIIALFEKENRPQEATGADVPASGLKKLSVGVIVATVIVVAGFLALKNTAFVQKSPVLSRFASISATDGTTESRVMIWKMAIQGFEERPLLGWGQENFNLVFSKYYNPLMYGQEPWFDRAHNVFFDWLVSAGILGIFGYLALFAAGIWTLFRNPRFSLAEKAILTGLFAGYFFQNLFVFDNLGSYFMFFTLLAFVSYGSEIGHGETASAAAGGSDKNSGVSAASVGMLDQNVGLVQIGTILIAVIAAFGIYYLNVPEVEANHALIRALQSGKISDFQAALAYGTFADSEIREQLLQASLSSLSDGNLSNDQKLAAINLAASEMQKQVAEAPLDVRTKLLYGTLLADVGLPDQALPVLNDAHAMSPNKQPILFAIATAYLEKKDYPDALAAAKQAYDLAPAYRQAASVYASVAIEAGKQADADTIFKAYPDLESTDGGILQAYIAEKDYAKISAIWKARFAKDPNNPDLHIAYAGSLAGFGLKQAAITEMNAAITLETAVEKDAAKRDAYIKNVQGYIVQIVKS